MQLNLLEQTEGEILAEQGLTLAVNKADRDYTDWSERIEGEVWKDIVGYDYPYQVSNIGNVRLLDRKTCDNSQIRKGRKKFIPGRTMPQRIRSEYLSVSFRRNKKSVDCVVHRLMGIAFIPNPENLPVMNHINGIKTDNRVENLEWTTVKLNTIHAYDMGLAKSGENSWRSKLTEDNVKQIKKLIAEKDITHNKIAKMFNISRSSIYAIKSGQNWKRLKTG